MILSITPRVCLAAFISPAPTPPPARIYEPGRLPISPAAIAPTPGRSVPPYHFPTRVPATAAPATPAPGEAPRVLKVGVTPREIIAGENTTVTFEAVILDPDHEVTQVRLQRLGPSGPVDVGPFSGASTGRTYLYRFSLPLLERGAGRIDFQVIADYQPPVTLYSFARSAPHVGPVPVSLDVRPGAAPPTASTPRPIRTPVPVYPPGPVFTPRPGKINQRSDLGLRIKVPEGWQVDEELPSLGGPLNINTFNSQYIRPGGIIPSNQASIDITRVPVPAYPEEVISKELEDSEVRSRDDNFQVAGISGKRIAYRDAFAPGMSNENVVVYLTYRGYLYKFYLTYYQDDPQESRFLNSFRQVLDSVEFIP